MPVNGADQGVRGKRGNIRRQQTIFTTVRSEGALLPADLLQRIAQGDAGLEGLTPESYNLLKTEKLNEAINRSWNRLLSAWTPSNLRGTSCLGMIWGRRSHGNAGCFPFSMNWDMAACSPPGPSRCMKRATPSRMAGSTCLSTWSVSRWIST